MGLFNRLKNTTFKQQRMKAWQPVLTPKTVLSTLFNVALSLAPIGGLLIWGSGQVTEMTFDYTQCDSAGGNASSLQDAITNHAIDNPTPVGTAPVYAFFTNDSAAIGEQHQCIIQFEIPYDIKPTVLLYYKLTGFHQNHRRYMLSSDPDQLRGKWRSTSDLQKGKCDPVARVTYSDETAPKGIYPCGLIANSMFNDSFSNLTEVEQSSSSSESNTYILSESGIVWPGEEKRYVETPGNNISELVPPPNWALKYPNGYTSDNPPPNLRADVHLQVWMRTAGLSTFHKLWARNDHDVLRQGTYQITVFMNYPVKSYSGTKSIVISTVSWVGGKNPFLGWLYVATSATFFLIAIAGTVRYVLKPSLYYRPTPRHTTLLSKATGDNIS
ncbi:Lem3/Cdc50 [Stereum hirsutum FP-91666 SS1]|uniref:Lem3/Cdc50 n=1 Tax=Stereum hirsutum (strain FP-91666) TaxID=721885 RepID=UPI000440C9A4|nr:Lem3/Cdc50 [Stereum hirsutum FP-91666 SS1]EIM92949.1 Lem3/Cdc50 [Stereum hirsutum FP-91666 SS1]